MCVQALAPQLFGLDRARAILEWEAMQGTAPASRAVVASTTGGFITFAVTAGRRPASHFHLKAGPLIDARHPYRV
jgi:hypothetical protein